MPDGTTVEIFAPRIHKVNAVGVREGAQEAITRASEVLLCLAVATPQNGLESMFEIRREVEDAIEEIERSCFERLCAQNIIDFPEDCQDDLDPEEVELPHPPCVECGQVGFHKMSCGRGAAHD